VASRRRRDEDPRGPRETAGIFEWRVPHAFLKDLRIVFLAHMRMRGGCGDDFLFPTFDRWTGWKAVIPMGVEWRYDSW
jgi:hypothetical protein